jgi:hypothetical protein
MIEVGVLSMENISASELDYAEILGPFIFRKSRESHFQRSESLIYSYWLFARLQKRQVQCLWAYIQLSKEMLPKLL